MSESYVEITASEAKMLYNLNFEIVKVKHFKGRVEVSEYNKEKDGTKIIIDLRGIDYFVREEVFNSFYGIE